MELKPIKALKKGEYFKRKADAKAVFVRDDYIRETKRFAACDFHDICRYVYLKPNTLVVVGFDF